MACTKFCKHLRNFLTAGSGWLIVALVSPLKRTRKTRKERLPDGPQTVCLQLIREYIREHHVSPSLADLASLMGKTRNSPQKAVAHLIANGLLVRRLPARERNLAITRAGYRELAKKSKKPEAN